MKEPWHFQVNIDSKLQTPLHIFMSCKECFWEHARIVPRSKNPFPEKFYEIDRNLLLHFSLLRLLIPNSNTEHKFSSFRLRVYKLHISPSSIFCEILHGLNSSLSEMKQITDSFKALKALKHVQSVNFITCRTGKANIPVRKFHLSNAHVGLHEGSSLYDYRLQKKRKLS